MSGMKLRLRHDTRSVRNKVAFPHRGVPCFAAADWSTQRSTRDNFRRSYAAKLLIHPTEVRACRDLTRGGGYAPSHRRAEVCRSRNLRQRSFFVEDFAFDKPLSSKFVEKEFVEGSLKVITTSLRPTISGSATPQLRNSTITSDRDLSCGVAELCSFPNSALPPQLHNCF